MVFNFGVRRIESDMDQGISLAFALTCITILI